MLLCSPDWRARIETILPTPPGTHVERIRLTRKKSRTRMRTINATGMIRIVDRNIIISSEYKERSSTASPIHIPVIVHHRARGLQSVARSGQNSLAQGLYPFSVLSQSFSLLSFVPDHTVPYGTVLSRDAFPGTSCQATIGVVPPGRDGRHFATASS